MKSIFTTNYRHPRESGGPGATVAALPPWIPAFAGMTTKTCRPDTHWSAAPRRWPNALMVAPTGRAVSRRGRLCYLAIAWQRAGDREDALTLAKTAFA